MPESLAPSGPAIPAELATPGLSLQQVQALLKAHWRQSLLIAVGVLMATAVIAKLTAKTYTATATLMVRNDQRDPMEVAVGQQQSLGTYMATEIQLMQSAEVLLPVVQKLHLTENKDYTVGYRGEGSLAEWVKDALYKDLSIEPGPAGSQLFYVSASAHSASLAADIANTVANVYLEQEKARVSGPASERAKRYAEELAELKEKVRLAQDQVTAFRQRTGVTDATARSSTIESDLLATLETRLQEAQNARRAAEVKAAGDPRFASGPTVSTSVDTLKTQIDTEQAQLAQLQTTLGARHPKVLELQNQIAANQRLLNEKMQHVSAQASAELTAAREVEAKLTDAVAQQRAKVLSISRMQDEGTKYVLELESAQSVYKRALDGYDQIMFVSGNRFSNITLVSSAVPPQKASRPNKIKMVAMGAFAGIGLGLALPIGIELVFRRRIRCRDDLEREFSVPVLMEFGALTSLKAKP